MTATYSVVIPVYNGELTLVKCLNSILSQTLLPAEAVVIDDASTDETQSLLLAFAKAFSDVGVRLVVERFQKNVGPAAARNKGVGLSRSEYIAFLDADDVWVTDKLSIVDRFASERSTADLIGHSYSDSEMPSPRADDPVNGAKVLSLHKLLLRNPIQTSCAVVRRKLAPRFNESMRYCEDYDLWMRIAEHSEVLWLVGRPLTWLGRPQLAAGGLSGDTLRMRIGEMRVYKGFCARNWAARGWLLPLLLLFSLSKHVYSVCRRRLRRR